MKPDASDAVALVLGVLDRLEISYLVGGSVASSIFGHSRPTMDLDLVDELRPEQVDEFAAAHRGTSTWTLFPFKKPFVVDVPST